MRPNPYRWTHCVAATVLSLSLVLGLPLCSAQFPTSLPPNLPGFQLHAGGYGRPSLNIRIPASTIQEWLKSGKLKFQDAVLADNYAKAKRYVKQDFVDDKVKDHSPIFYAAARGNTAMVEMLVRDGASVKARDDGKSLAYIAAACGCNSTAKKLVELGGGSQGDLSRGRALYVENGERRRKEAQMANALALTFVAAMLQSGAGGSSSNDVGPSQADVFEAEQTKRNEHENYDAEQRGENPPHYGYGSSTGL